MSAHDNAIGADLVERFWPYDGPCDAEQLGEAAAACAELVRYLNNHTRTTQALPYACDLYDLVTALWVTSTRLDQLLAQLATRTRQLSSAPGLYDDRDNHACSETALAAAEALTTARRLGLQLAAALQQTCNHIAHLGGPDSSLPESGHGEV